MVLDTSVLIAIVRGEPDADALALVILHSSSRAISAVSYVESCMVLAGNSSDVKLRELDSLLVKIKIRIEAVTHEDAQTAREAFLRFGKGRHPAKLNLGDCFAYALAKRLDEPLLFKGNDFAQTDILRA